MLNTVKKLLLLLLVLTTIACGATSIATPIVTSGISTEQNSPNTPSATYPPVPTATPTVTPTSVPTATITPTPMPVAIVDGKGVEMALIPAGTFQMGYEEDTIRLGPSHTVPLDAFYMDIYEVTNAAYEACVVTGACSPPYHVNSNTRNSYYNDAGYSAYPVIYVSWFQASEYCAWREARLPTEAEWEYAARGGLARMQYPWGDDEATTALAVFQGRDTRPVGSRHPNDYGLYDMAGNVWEWVGDWYDGEYYSTYPEGAWPANPTGPDTGEYRVLRGGHYGGNAWLLSVFIRFLNRPGVATDSYGFRCALPVSR